MKAILVIDMPESCKDCRLKYFDNGDDAYFGGVTERCVIDGSEISISGRYDDCPLKPMPEELITPYMFRQEMIALGLQNEDGTVSVYSEDYMEGWNDCIQALLGEEGEEE